MSVANLAAQCEIPGPYRAIPLRDRIADGVSHAFCLVFRGYRASIAEIPLVWGVSQLHVACSPRGTRPEKGRGYRTQLPFVSETSRNNARAFRPLRTIASHGLLHNYCDSKNYCGNTPCGIHPFSEVPKFKVTNIVEYYFAILSVPPIVFKGKSPS